MKFMNSITYHLFWVSWGIAYPQWIFGDANKKTRPEDGREIWAPKLGMDEDIGEKMRKIRDE